MIIFDSYLGIWGENYGNYLEGNNLPITELITSTAYKQNGVAQIWDNLNIMEEIRTKADGINFVAFVGGYIRDRILEWHAKVRIESKLLYQYNYINKSLIHINDTY